MTLEPVNEFKACLLKTVKEAGLNVSVTVTKDDNGITIYIDHKVIDFRFRQYIPYYELYDNSVNIELVCLKLVEELEHHWNKFLYKEVQ